MFYIHNTELSSKKLLGDFSLYFFDDKKNFVDFRFFAKFWVLLLVVRVLIDAHEVLGDAEVVDHLSYAEERGYDNHTTERALKECSGALLQKIIKLD